MLGKRSPKISSPFRDDGRVARARLTRVPHATFVWLHGDFRWRASGFALQDTSPQKQQESKSPPNQLMVGRDTLYMLTTQNACLGHPPSYRTRSSTQLSTIRRQSRRATHMPAGGVPVPGYWLVSGKGGPCTGTGATGIGLPLWSGNGRNVAGAAGVVRIGFPN